MPRWISECPRLGKPAAVNVFNYSFLLYRASNFHLRAGHLHLTKWLVPLLSSTAPLSPPGTSRMGPSAAGDPSPAQGTLPVTDLPCSSSARPHVMSRTVMELGRASPCPSSSEHKRRAPVLAAAINAAGAVSPGEASSGD